MRNFFNRIAILLCVTAFALLCGSTIIHQDMGGFIVNGGLAGTESEMMKRAEEAEEAEEAEPVKPTEPDEPEEEMEPAAELVPAEEGKPVKPTEPAEDPDVVERNTAGLLPGVKYVAYKELLTEFSCVDESHRIVQGGYFNGTSYYVAFIENDDPASRVIIAEINMEGEIIRQSEALDLAHANNITMDTARGELLVTHCQQVGGGRTSSYSYVSLETLEITESGVLDRPFFAMGYSGELGLYGSGAQAGSTIDVWSGELELLRSFEVDKPETLSQGVWCDSSGIWFIRSAQDGYGCEIRVYDWENGELLYEIPIENMTVEPESLTIYGGELYAICDNSTHDGGIVYKLKLEETT